MHSQRTGLYLCMVALLCVSICSLAQQPRVNSPLLDKLQGDWVIKGVIAGKDVVHDLHAEWVLDHHYLRLHEVSREKKPDGQPQYEATVFIAWNEQPKQYACVWLDVYGGLSAESTGYASPKENELPFLFKDEKGEINFSNDFIYDARTQTWEWHMDNINKGVAKPYAQLKLARAR